MRDILDLQLTPSEAAAESAVGDEIIILHLTQGTYYGLDAVGARMWTLIKQGVALGDICQRVSEEFSTDLATVKTDARNFFRDLQAQGLLVVG